MNADVLLFEEIPPELFGQIGGKGATLVRLVQNGFPVPGGFVVFPGAFEGDQISPQAWDQARGILNSMREVNPGVSFAVRSSASSEDSAGASYAGEFETLLNMRHDNDMLNAIHTVYRSRNNERVQAYRQAMGGENSNDFAVIIQKMAAAESSGILFTANPVTGQRGEAVLTAAWGLGEAIVGGLVTPDTFIIRKEDCHILKREISDKAVRTVLLESGTEEQPVPKNLRRAPALLDIQVIELVRLGMRVEKLFAMPVDIEWVCSEEKILLVQARPITALPEPEPPAPTKWELPHGQYAAMRNNIVELMPRPLSPLFATLGREAINLSLGNLAGYFLGKPDIMPKEIVVTVNGYAYNSGSVNPLKALGMILDTPGILKRMFTGAVERWTDAGRPRYIGVISRMETVELEYQSCASLVESACALYTAAVDAYGSLISGLIPAAWMSEALFTRFYNAFIRRRGDPAAPIFLLGFDSIPIQAEKGLFTLARWAGTHKMLTAYLGCTPAGHIAACLKDGSTPPGVDPGDWVAWRERFDAHLQRYGHMIYDLDFSNPVPADDPVPLLETCQIFLRGEGADPCSRQEAAVQKREQAVQLVNRHVKGWRLKTFHKYLIRAQKYAPLREDGLADVGLGYPLLRRILGELGRRYVDGGSIQYPCDIYWLTKDELLQAAARLDGGTALGSLQAEVIERKAAWRAASRVTPPMMLPQMKLLGMDLSELKTRRARKLKGNIIKGVATSPGTVTGPACVLKSVEDFSKLKPGDILVAAITTPAWTPLFARAAGLVTDIGGPLSHGSIVAREYGIPAVLGTAVATQRIRNGQMITVNGANGTVQIS